MVEPLSEDELRRMTPAQLEQRIRTVKSERRRSMFQGNFKFWIIPGIVGISVGAYMIHTTGDWTLLPVPFLIAAIGRILTEIGRFMRF